MTMTKPSTGQLYATRTRRGRYVACQVVCVDAEHAEIVALDWIGEEPPRSGELERARPLVLNHHAWMGELKRIMVEPDVPEGFELVGEAPLVVSPHPPSNAYSSWNAIPLQVEAQHQWDHELSDEVREAYHQAKSRRGEDVELDLGAGGVHTVPVDAWRLWIGAASSTRWQLLVPEDAAIRWEALEALGALTEVEYFGRDAGFAPWVSSRRLISRVFWHKHGQTRIDLSTSALEEFGCGAEDEALELVLPEGLRSLHVNDVANASSLRVVHPHEGDGLHLSVRSQELWAAPRGLSRLSVLSMSGLRRADCAILVGYPELRELELEGAPGELCAPDALLRLRELRALSLRDFYAGELAALPAASAWPRLQRLEVRGLRATDAALLRKRLKGIPQLEIAGAKSDARIRENLENPFRDWVDERPALGKAACAAWKKARVALRKLGSDATRAQIEPVLVVFIEAFNRLERKHGLDTIRREEVCDAYDGLCLDVQSAIDEASANELLDRLREF